MSRLMSLRIFDEPIAVAEPSPETDASFPLRIVFCFWAAMVAIPPAATTAYSGLAITNVIRNARNAETAGSEWILGNMHAFNRPLVIVLAVSALLAFGMALAVAINPKCRLNSVGYPFSVIVSILAIMPAVFLWFAETTITDVLAGRLNNSPVDVVAQRVSNLLFCAISAGLVAQGAAFFGAIISLCIPAKRRADALSLRRAFIWAVSGTLLLAFTVAFLLAA